MKIHDVTARVTGSDELDYTVKVEFMYRDEGTEDTHPVSYYKGTIALDPSLGAWQRRWKVRGYDHADALNSVLTLVP